jgi:DNA-binding XRE family transcriptional regulator
MNRNNKIPRIIKINKIEYPKIFAMFSNGESRYIDLENIFKKLKIKKNSPEEKLLDPKIFQNVKLANHTLSWENPGSIITNRNGNKINVPYEIGADILYKYSMPDFNSDKIHIGEKIKKERQKQGMTQEELAALSGTTKFYISRIENNRTGIELRTLIKIIEAGLGKELKLVIK